MTALSQTRAIHALRRQIPHYTDADYRSYLLREFGVDSSTKLTRAQAGKVIETLKTLAGQNSQVRRASETATGKYAGKLRALWISAWNLGIVRSRDDKAMLAFVARQTKLSHTRFLTDPADARKAIEALKSWIAREAGVEWPAMDQSDGFADTKREVARAACRRLVESGAFDLDGLTFDQAWPSRFVAWCFKVGHVPTAGVEFYRPEHWDAMANAAGRWLRVRAKKRKAV